MTGDNIECFLCHHEEPLEGKPKNVRAVQLGWVKGAIDLFTGYVCKACQERIEKGTNSMAERCLRCDHVMVIKEGRKCCGGCKSPYWDKRRGWAK